MTWQNESLTVAQRMELASAQAQISFRTGSEAWHKGEYAKAWDWLERANRQARGNSHVMFALALARQTAGDLEGAIRLTEELLQKYDFREGWVLLATFYHAKKNASGVLRALNAILSRYAITLENWSLVGNFFRTYGVHSWCAVDGDGLLKTGFLKKEEKISITIDGKPTVIKKTKQGCVLSEKWKSAQIIEVKDSNGVALFGSPLQPKTIASCEGLVSVGINGLSGWCWLPYDADRAPVINFYDHKKETCFLSLPLDEFSSAVSSDKPLARYRNIFIPWDKIPDGPVHVVGPDGRDLLGSPLEVRMQTRSAQKLALNLNKCSDIEKHAQHCFSKEDSFLPLLVSEKITARPVVSKEKKQLVVIIPIFKNASLTMACLQSVRKSIERKKIKVFIVNDASQEKNLIQDIKNFCSENKNFHILNHSCNRGFPAAVNTGLKAAGQSDVVILNSDTIVPTGWLEELRRIAYSQTDIGTVTPFSNEASIFSYPSIVKTNTVPTEEEAQVYMGAAQAANAGQFVDVPTANGFCMYVRHDCLNQTGLLREDVFAQGYGEENDFCMRARALGWRHVAAVGAYVAHVGSASFGVARSALLQRNSDILEKLHPGYHAFIDKWVTEDRLFPARRRMDLVRFRSERKNKKDTVKSVVFVTHSHGGGVERVVQQRAAALQCDGLRVLILRSTKTGCVLQDAADKDGSMPSLVFSLPDEWSLLTRILRAETVQWVEFHHLADHHALLYTLPAHLACAYDVYVHDYMWFCQRISLLGPYGTYCGEPDVAGCMTCVALAGRHIAETIDVPAYHERSQKTLAAARTVYAPSNDTAARMARHFPDLVCKVFPWEQDKAIIQEAKKRIKHDQVSAQSNQLNFIPASGALGSDGGKKRIRLCVIGGIGTEKGYDILRLAALDAALRDLPLEFVVVGHTPDDATLIKTQRIFVTGEYREEDAVNLVASMQADAVFLPATWPETWCFTLGIAWKAGLSVIAFDLGAPAERIRATGRGRLINPALSGKALNTVLIKEALFCKKSREL
ncbi:hypothetical protein HK13_08680 [Acetobacter indonesiensis]|uniref:glycosyltransferase n=1 Tax=Acetobacter indonesiensis TaxID=104101 RepID=UPI000A3B1E01|nr:glycosyltransferase [Acetobacter indonesiensis]OUI92927.1 hypothetical protein HK13_08680 [Acetobacter indonesiensis]